jgi:hypothetical protein
MGLAIPYLRPRIVLGQTTAAGLVHRAQVCHSHYISGRGLVATYNEDVHRTL